MAICGDVPLLSTLYSLRPPPSSSKTQNITGSFTRGVTTHKITPKWLRRAPFNCISKPNKYCCFAKKGNEQSALTVDHNNDEFLLNAVTMNFIERLSLAWRILFPTTAERKHSNAKIAKHRLKMILFSDRCALSDAAEQKIVKNIVEALSDFVEIESQDRVQLSLSVDADLGTMYSVTIPVQHVKPEHGTYKGVTSVEYNESFTSDASHSSDVELDFMLSEQ